MPKLVFQNREIGARRKAPVAPVKFKTDEQNSTYKFGFLYSLIALFTSSLRSLISLYLLLVSVIVNASTLLPCDSGMSQAFFKPAIRSSAEHPQPRSLHENSRLVN